MDSKEKQQLIKENIIMSNLMDDILNQLFEGSEHSSSEETTIIDSEVILSNENWKRLLSSRKVNEVISHWEKIKQSLQDSGCKVISLKMKLKEQTVSGEALEGEMDLRRDAEIINILFDSYVAMLKSNLRYAETAEALDS